MKRTSIFLADDHALFREGLAGILAAQADMEVVGEASDGLEAIIKVQNLRPDLVLLDIQMPGCDGLEAARQIKKDLPDTTIIMLTVQDDDEKLFQAIKNGAQGYLLKNINSREMLNMLRGALRGEAAIAPALAGRMLEEFRRLSRLAPVPAGEEVVSLTAREQQVLALVAIGKTDKEVAEQLCLSLHTVKSHMRSILSRLHASNRREAAHLAKQRGLI